MLGLDTSSTSSTRVKGRGLCSQAPLHTHTHTLGDGRDAATANSLFFSFFFSKVAFLLKQTIIKSASLRKYEHAFRADPIRSSIQHRQKWKRNKRFHCGAFAAYIKIFSHFGRRSNCKTFSFIFLFFFPLAK